MPLTRTLALVVCVAATAASAEPARTAQAREFFKQARERYEAGAYGESTVLFQQSYELSKAPGLLFNLGQAWRKLGDCGAALKAYRAFIEADPRAPNAGEARALAAAMDRCQQEKVGQAPAAPAPSLTAALTSVAPSEPAPTSQARELFKQGRERYEAGAYGEATVLFQQSYELSRAPGLLFNLGQAWRKLGDCGAALKVYQTFVEIDPGAANAAEARELAAAMSRCKEEKLALAAAGSAPRSVSGAVGADSELVALANPPPPPSPWLTAAAISLDALGVAVLATGAGFSWSAHTRSSQLEQFYASPGTWTSALATTERLGQRDSAAGMVLLISGAAFALIGVVVTMIRFAGEAS